MNLLLRHVIDDGAVFYLNGVEIHRFGFATNVNVVYTSFSGGNENASRGPFLVPRASLRNGENVFAVEVHQSDGTSSDIVFGAELFVATDPNAVPARLATFLPGDLSMNIATNATIDIQIEDGTTSVVQSSKDFNDAAWLEGAAILAAETGATVEPIRTILSRVGADGTTQIITDYFRTRFTFTGDPATTRLAIRHAVDDGALFYLNGQEIHRFYFMPGVTDITYTNTAGVDFIPTDHENRWEGPFIIPTTALVAGENVIAVEVHQNGPASSDVVFGMELLKITSGTTTPPETRFTSVTLASGSVRFQWTGPGTLQERDSLSSGDWNDILNAPNPYTTLPTGTIEFYRVRQ